MFPFLEEADRSEPHYSIWTRSTRQRSEAIFQPQRNPGELVHTPSPPPQLVGETPSATSGEGETRCIRASQGGGSHFSIFMGSAVGRGV